MNFVQFITPLNLAAEKEKFFASADYQPQFAYNWSENSFHQKYQALAAAMMEQNFAEIVSRAEQVFETTVDDQTLQLARSITATKPELLPPQSIDDLVQQFTQKLSELGLTEYQVEVVDQHGFNIRPSLSTKKLIVSQHANLDFFSVDGEVKHELLHVIRAENNLFNHLTSSPNYLPTEEGFASYVQDECSLNGEAARFQHAAEFVATEVGLKGSLRDIVNCLQVLGFSADLAWKRGVRHKFGWIDTAQPGDIMKPAMYFFHQQQVKKLSVDQKYRLLSGKIAISDLDRFSNYSGRVALPKLQHFFDFQT